LATWPVHLVGCLASTVSNVVQRAGWQVQLANWLVKLARWPYIYLDRQYI